MKATLGGIRSGGIRKTNLSMNRKINPSAQLTIDCNMYHIIS